MLLQLFVTQPLDELGSDILIRVCILGSRSAVLSPAGAPMGSPEKASNFFERSLDSAPACATIDIEVPD